jgi:hypothetical protein
VRSLRFVARVAPTSAPHPLSQVDVESPDVHRFPLFATAPYWEGELRPGDMCVRCAASRQ